MSDEQKHIAAVVFKNGDVLFREHEKSYHFYIIQSGKVEVCKVGEDGKRVLLATVSAGTPIGEFAMIDRRPRSATATAVGEVHAALVSEEAYQHLISELPDWSVSMMKALVERIRHQNEIIRRSTANVQSVRKEIDSAEFDPETGTGTYAGILPNLGNDDDNESQK